MPKIVKGKYTIVTEIERPIYSERQVLDWRDLTIGGVYKACCGFLNKAGDEVDGGLEKFCVIKKVDEKEDKEINVLGFDGLRFLMMLG